MNVQYIQLNVYIHRYVCVYSIYIEYIYTHILTHILYMHKTTNPPFSVKKAINLLSSPSYYLKSQPLPFESSAIPM